MKIPVKKVFILAVVISSLCLAPLPACAEEAQLTAGESVDVIDGAADTFPENVIALDDLGVSVEVDEFASIRQEEGFIYIYTVEYGVIPYVIVGAYTVELALIADGFTSYMSVQYDDLEVELLDEGYVINDMPFVKVVYHYTVSGYDVEDIRLFTSINNRTYMVGTKQIAENDSLLPSETFLEDVAGSLAPLAGGSDSYVYHVYGSGDNALLSAPASQ